ncbi:hypothetical protein GWK47_051568 [Chionoecetes opilio]|uniref:Uncharacterized protein n=1 Tax=Chionoecetes opilio TaxID=41210 RepID=A0A8J4Y7B1_CHIOP|nr:hypothetical protein GWK47_051568 [Chionoecetes opilio]
MLPSKLFLSRTSFQRRFPQQLVLSRRRPQETHQSSSVSYPGHQGRPPSPPMTLRTLDWVNNCRPDAGPKGTSGVKERDMAIFAFLDSARGSTNERGHVICSMSWRGSFAAAARFFLVARLQASRPRSQAIRELCRSPLEPPRTPCSPQGIRFHCLGNAPPPRMLKMSSRLSLKMQLFIYSSSQSSVTWMFAKAPILVTVWDLLTHEHPTSECFARPPQSRPLSGRKLLQQKEPLLDLVVEQNTGETSPPTEDGSPGNNRCWDSPVA